MAVVGVLTVVMGVNNAPLTAGLASASAQLKGFGGVAGAATAAVRTAAVGIGLAAVAGAALGINAAADFEDAFAGVRKTVDETELAAAGLTFDDLAAQFRAMATEIPVAATELAAIGETAGALGIRAQDIDDFTRTVALLGATTDLSTGVAAEALGKVGTILGLTGGEFEDFADILVNLGNKGASTESEIIEITKRFAAAGQAVGLTTPQILAFSSAIASAGVEPEAAGSSLSRLFTGMVKGAATGSKAGKEFAKLTGQSFGDFSKLVETDTVGAMQMVLESLQGLDKFGQIRALSAIGITNVRDQDAVRKLAQTYETNLLPALKNAGAAQGALTTEAEKRFDTFNTKVQLLGQNFNELLITIGTPLLPIATDFIESITRGAQAIADWAKANSGIASSILPVAAAIAGLVVVGLSLGPILGAVGTAIAIITSPILLVVGGIIALAAHFGMLGVSAQGVAYHVGATIGKLAQSFIEWIGPMIPKVLAQLQVWGGQIVSWILARAPALLAQMQTWASAFVAWIQPMIPRVLEALGRFGAAAIQWVLTQIPIAATALAGLASAFVDWIAPKIPGLVAKLGEFGLALLDWVGKQVPIIIAKVLEWGGALVGWVGDSWPAVSTALIEWLGKLLAWFNEIAPQVAEAAINLGSQIAEGIIQGIGDIGARIAAAITAPPTPVNGVIPPFERGANPFHGIGIIGGLLGGGIGTPPTSNAPRGADPLGTIGDVIGGAGDWIFRGGRPSGAPVQINSTTTVVLDGEKVGSVTDRRLYNNASQASSGFNRGALEY